MPEKYDQSEVFELLADPDARAVCAILVRTLSEHPVDRPLATEALNGPWLRSLSLSSISQNPGKRTRRGSETADDDGSM